MTSVSFQVIFSLLLVGLLGILAGRSLEKHSLRGDVPSVLGLPSAHMPWPAPATEPLISDGFRLDSVAPESPVGPDMLAEFALKSCFEGWSAAEELPRSWLYRDTVSIGLTDPERPERFPDLRAHPGLVKIEIIQSQGGSDREHCSAVRVSRHWFLTAAHCFEAEDPGRARPVYDAIVLTPSVDARGPGTEVVPISHAFCHQEHGVSRLRYPTDVALFYIEDVSPLISVAIAELERGEMYLKREDVATSYISGWGRNGGSRYLQGGPVSISLFGESVLESERIGPRGPNVGDSGAPLYTDFGEGPLVIGVLSQVTQDREAVGQTGIYVRAKAIHDWVKRTQALCEREGKLVC